MRAGTKLVALIAFAALMGLMILGLLTACTVPIDPSKTTTTAESTTTTEATTTTTAPPVTAATEQTTTTLEVTTTTLARSLIPRFTNLNGPIVPFSFDAPLQFDPSPYTNYTGNGNSVIQLADHLGTPLLLNITGNAALAHFVVKGFDGTGNPTYTLVDAVDKYHGNVLIDWFGESETKQLQVAATGPWSVAVKPFTDMRVVPAPGTIKGTGDDVIRVTGLPNKLTITGNKDGAYFGILFIDPTGNRSQVLVDTIEPYQGDVVMPGAGVLLIEAVGAWTIKVAGTTPPSISVPRTIYIPTTTTEF
jgi:hypothetical protein